VDPGRIRTTDLTPYRSETVLAIGRQIVKSALAAFGRDRIYGDSDVAVDGGPRMRDPWFLLALDRTGKASVYRKWTGGFWRFIAASELGAGPGDLAGFRDHGPRP
jgi:hypothetical protein